MRNGRPRLGFIGLGWIGRHRLEALVEAGVADVVAVADADPLAVDAARPLAPGAARGASLDDVLDEGVDGVVVATPNALHAVQTAAALRAGAAVFCQKPLGRSALEVRELVGAARQADRLLGVDMCYRYTTALGHVYDLARGGAVGDVLSIDLVFHNAYGPDKAWFYDPALSGGGCLLDLGLHLVDFVHWTLADGVRATACRLYAGGQLLASPRTAVEDLALATLDLDGGATARLACSWRLAAGGDARIGITVYGTRGGAEFRNVNGSFYDFVAERFDGRTTARLSEPPDAWGGRALVDWARRLAAGERFDPAIEAAVDVARTLDRLYASATRPEPATAVRPPADRR